MVTRQSIHFSTLPPQHPHKARHQRAFLFSHLLISPFRNTPSPKRYNHLQPHISHPTFAPSNQKTKSKWEKAKQTTPSQDSAVKSAKYSYTANEAAKPSSPHHPCAPHHPHPNKSNNKPNSPKQPPTAKTKIYKAGYVSTTN